MIILGSLLLSTLISKLTKVYGMSRSLRPYPIRAVVAWWASEEHRKLYESAESDSRRWKREFDDPDEHFPVTEQMVTIGYVSRGIKVLLPIAGAGFLFIGAVRK